MSGWTRLPGLISAPLVSDWLAPEQDGLALRSGRSELGQGGARGLRPHSSH